MAQFFLGIGGQKCGSSWLAWYLAKHPSVFVPPIKEMHVFDWVYAPDLTLNIERRMGQRAAWLESFSAPLTLRQQTILRTAHEILDIVKLGDRRRIVEAYSRFFRSKVGPQHLAFGEITPAYAVLPAEALDDLQSVFPDAKLIFLIRDPVDRYWSALNQIQRRRQSFDPLARFEDYLGDNKHALRSEYEKTFEVLDRSVGPEQTLVVFYEDLFSPHGRNRLREITAFLDIEFVEADLTRVINPGRKLPLPREKIPAAARRFAPTYEYIARRFPDLPEIWRERLELSRSGQ